MKKCLVVASDLPAGTHVCRLVRGLGFDAVHAHGSVSAYGKLNPLPAVLLIIESERRDAEDLLLVAQNIPLLPRPPTLYITHIGRRPVEADEVLPMSHLSYDSLAAAFERFRQCGYLDTNSPATEEAAE